MIAFSDPNCCVKFSFQRALRHKSNLSPTCGTTCAGRPVLKEATIWTENMQQHVRIANGPKAST
ncbi:unnamed protein product [Protopolystoma xenopodis]|uniref:Uncharacterized protein n=1 Tax=Protopolystoma xenopodis TaxID=117903 RepID=A0A3S5CKM8_9PLAT|nr:unnamed protein product [Protopolystoma xenopodis]